jgi:hypothetical protein
MSKTFRTLRYSLIFIVSIVLSSTGCISTKKSWVLAKSEKSMCDLSRLGKNKYFYSAQYQRKLRKSELKIGGKY